MIRRPPRSTLDRSSAASDVYKRQVQTFGSEAQRDEHLPKLTSGEHVTGAFALSEPGAVSYTHLRAHETVLDIVCRLLLETQQRYVY